MSCERRTNREVFGWSPRDDPFEGRTVQPESCRELIRTGGRTADTFDELPADLPYANAFDQSGASPSVELVSLPAPLRDKYMDLLVKPVPQCSSVRIGAPSDGETASIVERALPGYGQRSRYVVRSYVSQRNDAGNRSCCSVLRPTSRRSGTHPPAITSAHS
jgi:hypothetical protein